MTALSFDEAREAFEKFQERYAEFGAWDTEPRAVFVDLIEAVYEGRDPGPFVMPTVMAAHETQDGDFLQRLSQTGLVPAGTIGPADVARDVRWAHAACSALARGYTVRQIAIADTTNHPEEGWTEPENEQWVRIATAVYCPELAG